LNSGDGARVAQADGKGRLRLAWRMFRHLIQDAEGMWTWPRRPWLPLAVSLRMTRKRS
jgi:hypothetical protein